MKKGMGEKGLGRENCMPKNMAGGSILIVKE